MLNNLLQSYTFWFIGGFASCGFVFSWIYYVYDKVLAKNSYKRKVLELISDCYTILDQELLKLAYKQDLAVDYHNSFELRFNEILSIPEISNNNALKIEISNAKNRFLFVTSHAQSVCHDKERISRDTQNSITTVYLFQKESKPLIAQFNEHKTEIFKLCQHSLLGFRY